MPTRPALPLLALLALLLTACDGINQYQFRGKLLYAASVQPVTGVQVVLTPNPEVSLPNLSPSTTTSADGSFVATLSLPTEWVFTLRPPPPTLHRIYLYFTAPASQGSLQFDLTPDMQSHCPNPSTRIIQLPPATLPATTRPPGVETTDTIDAQTAYEITNLLDSFAKSTPPGASPSAQYKSAWAIAILFERATKDKDAKAEIMRAWNLAWNNPANYPMLMYVLAWNGEEDQSLATPAVRDAWKSFKDQATIQPMAYWIVYHGTDADVHFMEQKHESLRGTPAAGILQNALNWRHFFDDPDRTSGPPTMLQGP